MKFIYEFNMTMCAAATWNLEVACPEVEVEVEDEVEDEDEGEDISEHDMAEHPSAWGHEG